MMDWMKMIGQAKDMQAKLTEIKSKVASIQVTGESGGGMVKATVNGNRKMIGLKIDPSLMHPNEAVILQDLIIGAVNIAMQNVQEEIKEMIKKDSGGLLANLPIDIDMLF